MTKRKKQTQNLEPRIDNRRARHDYRITETLECGIVLRGSEIKSIREGRINLSEGYVSIDDRGEMWLLNVEISLYPQAGPNSHIPRGQRKLLANRREIKKWKVWSDSSGVTIVPLTLYFVRGRAKLEIGLAEGKKDYDKRADMRERDLKRDISRAMTRKILK